MQFFAYLPEQCTIEGAEGSVNNVDWGAMEHSLLDQIRLLDEIKYVRIKFEMVFHCSYELRYDATSKVEILFLLLNRKLKSFSASVS